MITPKSTDLVDIVLWIKSSPMIQGIGFIDGLLAEMRRQLAARDELLRHFVDDYPCRFDHHGVCQEHSGGDPCAVDQARKLLSRGIQ